MVIGADMLLMLRQRRFTASTNPKAAIHVVDVDRPLLAPLDAPSTLPKPDHLALPLAPGLDLLVLGFVIRYDPLLPLIPFHLHRGEITLEVRFVPPDQRHHQPTLSSAKNSANCFRVRDGEIRISV